MLTGHGSIDTAIEAIRAGAFDYIAKRCPLGELEVRIHRALERHTLRRRAALVEHGLLPAVQSTNGVAPRDTAATSSRDANGPVPTLEQMERDHIELALRRTTGHRGQAAAMLGTSERNLYRKLRDYGLEQ